MIQEALARGLMVATAESLTAGNLAGKIADTPGASGVLIGSIISYQDQIKSELLGVSRQLIAAQSAVDPEVAIQMAIGVRNRFAKAMGLDTGQVIGVSTTGVAGPDSVGSHSPGEVFIAISSSRADKVFALQLGGSRAEIRAACVTEAIKLLREEILSFQV